MYSWSVKAKYVTNPTIGRRAVTEIYWRIWPEWKSPAAEIPTIPALTTTLEPIIPVNLRQSCARRFRSLPSLLIICIALLLIPIVIQLATYDAPLQELPPKISGWQRDFLSRGESAAS